MGTTPEYSEITRNVLTANGAFDQHITWTELHLQDGRTVMVETRLLQPGGDAMQVESLAQDLAVESDDCQVIPLVEEGLDIGRRVVETGRVRLQKTVTEFDVQLDEPLAVHTFDIERIVLNREIETAPAVRQEGETTVYPVVEEQLVLTKRLVLKEEVHVTRRDTQRHDQQVVTLKREHIIIEREGKP
jgi:uncharacterized protein (TIGR02271 family)